MPEQPKEAWEEIEAQLLKINQHLQALKSEVDADEKVNGKLLQQVTLLAGLIGTLNAKLKPK